MKKTAKTKATDEMRDEYDLSQLQGGLRGKYAKLCAEGCNIVVIDPDLSPAFPTAEAVNDALRLLLTVARSSSKNASQ